MTNDTFNCEIADAQATPVTPVEPAAFDMERYADYEARLLESNEAFWKECVIHCNCHTCCRKLFRRFELVAAASTV